MFVSVVFSEDDKKIRFSIIHARNSCWCLHLIDRLPCILRSTSEWYDWNNTTEPLRTLCGLYLVISYTTMTSDIQQRALKERQKVNIGLEIAVESILSASKYSTA